MSEGFWLAAAAAVDGALAVVFFRRARGRDLATLLTAASLTLAAIAAADFVSGATLAVVWAAEAAALAWLAARLRESRFQLAALAYLALSAGHTIALDLPPAQLFVASRHPADGILAAVAAALAAFAVAWWARPGTLDARSDDRAGFLGELDSLLAALAGAQTRVREGAVAVAAALGLGSIAAALLELVEATWRAGGTAAAFDRGHVFVTAAWAALGLAAVLLGLRRRIPALTNAALLWILAVVVKTLGYDVHQLDSRQWGLALAATGAAALLAGYAYDVLERGDRRVAVVGPLMATLALGLGVAAIAGIGRDWSPDALGAAYLGLAAGYCALGSTVLRRRRTLATVLWALGLLVAAPAVALVIQGGWLIAAWAAAGAGLVVLGARVREPRYEIASVAYVGLALLGTLVAEARPDQLVVAGAHPGHGLPSVAAVVAALLVLARFGTERVQTLWAAGAVALYGVSLAILELAERTGHASVTTSFQRGHTAVSALWGVLGLALLVFGLRRRSRALRLGGLALLAVSLAKLFLYDLATLSSITRALSFLAVGAVLLLGAFFYQRLSQETAPPTMG